MPRWRTNRNQESDWKSPTFFSSTSWAIPNCALTSRALRLKSCARSCAGLSNSALLKLKENCCGCQPVMVARLLFRNSPEAPVLCAEEIAKALKSHPEIRVRMGIHSGPVNEVTDLYEQANIAGAGINIAQRIMDCGDAGHVLVSKHAAEDLEQYDQWQPYLYDLGECEGKHGERLHVVNLYNNEIGNPAVPGKFGRKAIAGTPSSVATGNRRRYSIVAMAIGALIVLGATSLL